jgi:hypothetical protein
MTPFRPETPQQAELREAAHRQDLVVGFSTFVLSFIALLVVLGWLIARFVAPEAPWWDVLHMCINAILISFVAAMGLSVGALRLLDQIHYRRGVYPCPYCGRPQRSYANTCDCPDAQAVRAKQDEDAHNQAA